MPYDTSPTGHWKIVNFGQLLAYCWLTVGQIKVAQNSFQQLDFDGSW